MREPTLYYTNCDIPAKLFFDIMHNEDYQKLGTVSIEECEKAYDDISDEYFTILPNLKLKAFITKKAKIHYLTTQIAYINSLLSIICFTPLKVDERNLIIDELNTIDGVKINFKKDLKNLKSEIERVQNSVIGILNNQINSLKDDKEKKAEKSKYVFQGDIVRLRQALDGMHIDENISLYMYAELTKAAIDVSNQRKAQKNGRK